MSRALLLVVIVSVVVQTLCVLALNYRTHVNSEAFSDLSIRILSVSSASLKVLTDTFVYWIALRGIWAIFCEYEGQSRAGGINQAKNGC